MSEFNIVVVGDENVGKTTYINRLVTGEFTKNYNPTLGIEYTHLSLPTNHGDIKLNCYDCGKNFHIPKGADAAIIMFDVTSRSTFENFSKWFDLIRVQYGNIPVIACGNKVDIKDRVVKSRETTFHYPENGVSYYFDISAKSNYNFEKPFLMICRLLMNDDNVFFSEQPSIDPPSV